MLTKLNKIYLLLIVLFLSGTLFAQWSQHNGPRGRANILYADNYVVFAQIDTSRIYKTAPGSDNWVEAHSGIPSDYHIQNLIKAGNKFLVTASSSTVQGGMNTVFTSDNEGESWSQTTLSLSYIINYIAYIDSTIFVASNTSSGSPLHYSSDQGATWQECNGMVANGLTSMLKSGSKIFASTNLGVFVSVDKGVNWVKKNGEGIPQYVSFSVMVPDFASADGKIYGLINRYPSMITYSSTDEGDTWVADTASGLPGGGGEYFYSTPIIAQENIYVILTQDASVVLPTIYTTSDYGHTWSQLGVPPFYRAYTMRIGGGTMFVGTSSGILKSDDWATSWSEFSQGIIYNGNTKGFASVNGKLFTTFNSGVHSVGAYPGEWSPISLPDSTLFYSDIQSQNNILFLFSYSGIFKSENAGDSWIDISSNLPENFYPTVFKAGDSKIYLAGRLDSDQVLYFSDDAGATWKKNTVPVSYIANIEVTGNSVYLKSDKLYKTTDDGANWSALGTNGIDNPSRINAYTESNGRAIVYIWDINNPQVLYSDDGNSWSLASGLGEGNSVNSFMVDNNIVFAGTKHGVFISEDDGKTWVSKSEGIGRRDVQEVFSQGKYYVASVWDRAVWFIAKPKITSIETANTDIPESFILQQNYPNPFNPTTTISYAIPNSGFVELKIYDMLGSEVAVLVNKEQLLGNYKVEFNASTLSSGIYFYKLQSGNFSITKKLILLK